jgi:hypothetical protein
MSGLQKIPTPVAVIVVIVLIGVVLWVGKSTLGSKPAGTVPTGPPPEAAGMMKKMETQGKGPPAGPPGRGYPMPGAGAMSGAPSSR